MKARRFLGALLLSMLIACWPGNAWATVNQTVKAGFDEGQYQHVTVNENVDVSNETNAVFVQAYAPDEVEDKTASALVKGNVSLTSSNDISVVYVEGCNGDASADITGNITGKSDGDVNGIETWGYTYSGNGAANVTAGGNVSAESSSSNACGIYSFKGGVNVSGDVTAKGNNACGMSAYSDRKTEIDVKGGVYSTGCYAQGLTIKSCSGSDLSVNVGKGIRATVPGTEPEDWHSAEGIPFHNGGGKLTANINGDVEVTAANGKAIGIRTNHSGDEVGRPFGDGSSEILVHGNVISDGIGVVLDTFGENTDVNVLVEDEIQAKQVGVAIGRTWFADEGSETEPKLTVWKIGLNDRGKVVEWGDFGNSNMDDDEDGKAKAISDFEKHIMYLTKVEQPSNGGTLKAVDANGNDLSKSYGFPVAHEGEKVILKANLQSGWKIKAAYNGNGANKQQLSKDESGNYYIIVPKGGGITLSADLEKEPIKVAIPTGKTLTYNGKSQTGVAAGSNYTLFGTAKATKAGSYKATAKLKTNANYTYKWSDGTTGAKTIKWTIRKAANPLAIKSKAATVKYSAVKKKAQTMDVTKVITFIKKGQGATTYTKAGGNKKITINKTTGKVTVKKGLKKGAYQVKVKVTAGGNTNYKASAEKVVTIKVTVK